MTEAPRPLSLAETIELDAYGAINAFTPLPARATELWEREVLWGREGETGPDLPGRSPVQQLFDGLRVLKRR